MPQLCRPFHTFASQTGVGHYSARNDVPRDVPLPDVAKGYKTLSGVTPPSAILYNWDGGTDSPAAGPYDIGSTRVPQAYSTGAHRHERAMGAVIDKDDPMKRTLFREAKRFVMGFGLIIDPSTKINSQIDWDYIFQLRSNGSTPSPAPGISIYAKGTRLKSGVVLTEDSVVLRLNISGYGDKQFVMGPADQGNFHSYILNMVWSTSKTIGGFETWLDGKLKNAWITDRTAYDSNSDATARWGGGYRAVNLTGGRKIWLIGGEVWNGMPVGTPMPPDPTPVPDPIPVDTTPPTIHTLRPTPLEIVTTHLNYDQEFTDTSGVDSVKREVINEAGVVVWSFTEKNPPLSDSDDDPVNQFKPTSVPDGVYTLKTTATDKVGNSSTNSVKFIIDNVIEPPPPPDIDPVMDYVLAVRDDFNAIKGRLSTAEQWDKLTEEQRTSVIQARNRAVMGKDRPAPTS